MKAGAGRVKGGSAAIQADSIDLYIDEVPLGRTVQTPMGPVSNTVNLYVRVRDSDGYVGWGEIWCNFPRFTAKHRIEILRNSAAPLILHRRFDTPLEIWTTLTEELRILRLQSGEFGPIDAVVAGLDVAFWDIHAQKLGAPLWKLLGGASSKVPLYASIGRGEDIEATVNTWAARGFRRFKLRASGRAGDHLAVVNSFRANYGHELDLMLDMNSSWDLEAASREIPRLRDAGLAWLEEPIPADASAHEWQQLKSLAPMPLAAGENLSGARAFEEALQASCFGVLQPDLSKWGGFSGLLPVAAKAVSLGVQLCPHTFSGVPGAVASAHLLAGANSPDGVLEFGVGRPSPAASLLQDKLCGSILDLGDRPGLGLDLEPGALLHVLTIE